MSRGTRTITHIPTSLQVRANTPTRPATTTGTRMITRIPTKMPTQTNLTTPTATATITPIPMTPRTTRPAR